MDQPDSRLNSSSVAAFKLSASVEKVGAKLGARDKVTAWEIVRNLFKLHREYGGALTEVILAFEGDPSSAETARPFSQWVHTLLEVYDRSRVELVDTRLFILGLCVLDPKLEQFLAPTNVLSVLLRGLKTLFYDLLTPQARARMAGHDWVPVPDQRAESSMGTSSVTPGLEGLELSASVRSAAFEIGPHLEVNPGRIIQALLQRHPEYAGGRARELAGVELTQYDSRLQSVSGWLSEVRSLFNTVSAPQLHGRLVILGFCLLSAGLRDRLLQNDFLGSLEDELTEPVRSLLTTKGHEKLELLGGFLGKRPSLPDSVSFHPDLITAEDFLNRRPFAKALASRVRQLPLDGPFVVNLHGRWGAGKTKLLRMLKEELQANSGASGIDSSWVVVDFNAWQQQRLGSPWWAMMMAVFSQSRQALWDDEKTRWVGLWSRHLWWRAGLTRWILVALILASAVLVGTAFDVFSNLLGRLVSLTPDFKTLVDVIIGVLAGVSVVYGVWRGIWRWLRLGTAQGTCNLLESGHDPLEPLASQFSSTIRYIRRPVAVFVDDLDRCQVDYVVSLLEGIHTIFKGAGIVYVIAADRRWVCASYEKAYQDFTATVTEPGRPLGHFFLEKIFQLSFSVPRMSASIQEDYLRRLLQVKPEVAAEEAAKLHDKVQTDMRTADTPLAVRRIVETYRGTVGETIARGAAVVKLAEQRMEEQTEHHLQRYGPFMEYNPRAMKRLLNAYAINRDVSLLNDTRFQDGQLELWTILDLRWPLLAEDLAGNPDLVDHIKKGTPPLQGTIIDDRLRPLLTDPEVRRVVDAAGVPGSLDRDTIAKCASLRS